MRRCLGFLSPLSLVILLPAIALSQEPPPQPNNPASEPAGDRNRYTEATPPPPEHKRIFGIIPNYRTYPTSADYRRIGTREKWKIAVEDSFDRGTVVLAAAFAGQGQLTNSVPAFGQGVAGYARYFATSYADLVIGNFMTEAIYPTLLRQDPRYFRLGTGSGFSRFRYAVTRIFWTRTDRGRWTFNYSEIGGNATAVAISNAYYPDHRDVSSAVSKLAVQIGVDMTSNLLKEFWPDLHDKLSRKHKPATR